VGGENNNYPIHFADYINDPSTPPEIVSAIGNSYAGSAGARAQFDRMRDVLVNRVISNDSNLSNNPETVEQVKAYVNAFVDDTAEYVVLVNNIKTDHPDWNVTVLNQTYDPSKVDTSVLALAAPQQEGNILDGNATKLARLANGDYEIWNKGVKYEAIFPKEENAEIKQA